MHESSLHRKYWRRLSTEIRILFFLLLKTWENAFPLLAEIIPFEVQGWAEKRLRLSLIWKILQKESTFPLFHIRRAGKKNVYLHFPRALKPIKPDRMKWKVSPSQYFDWPSTRLTSLQLDLNHLIHFSRLSLRSSQRNLCMDFASSALFMHGQ